MFLQFVIDLEGQTENISPINNLGVYISRLLNLGLMVGTIAFMGYFVLGAIKWLTAGGDKGKTEEARGAITNAAVGLAILAASWAVFLLVDYFLGLDTIGVTNPDPTF